MAVRTAPDYKPMWVNVPYATWNILWHIKVAVNHLVDKWGREPGYRKKRVIVSVCFFYLTFRLQEKIPSVLCFLRHKILPLYTKYDL